MNLIKHTINTLFGNPRVVVMPTGSNEGVGYVSGPDLGRLVSTRGKRVVTIYADETSFSGLSGRRMYDIAIIKRGKITRYGPLFLSWVTDQKMAAPKNPIQREQYKDAIQRRSEKFGTKTLVFFELQASRLRIQAGDLGAHHKELREQMMKNEPVDARVAFRKLVKEIKGR